MVTVNSVYARCRSWSGIGQPMVCGLSATSEHKHLAPLFFYMVKVLQQ